MTKYGGLLAGCGQFSHGAMNTIFQGLLILPLLSLVSGQPAAVTWGTIAMILLTALKRLEANRAPLPDGTERMRVIGRRLWLDRD